MRLATLRAVLVHGSFSAAATALHLSQPAVSRQVGLLERQLGTVLVHRTRRGVRPTEAGRVLLAHTEMLLRALQRAEDDVRDLAGLGRGTVRLGSFFSALVHLSAELAAALGEHHPGLVVVDELVDREDALAGLRRGDLDLALVFEHDAGHVVPPAGIEVHPLFDDPLRIVLPAHHPLADRPALAVGDLAEETWIRAHSGSAARRLDAVLARAGIEPELLLAGHGDEPVETQALVAAGRGVALTYDLTVVVGRHDLVLRPLVDEPGVRRVQVAVVPGPRSPAVQVALDTLLAIGAAHRAAVTPTAGRT
ncbi:LysR family transcriptional regulator [Blastococcus sp. SYSU D00820]